jgi:hypothetical protein
MGSGTVLELSMALTIVSSLRMQATSATFLALPEATTWHFGLGEQSAFPRRVCRTARNEPAPTSDISTGEGSLQRFFTFLVVSAKSARPVRRMILRLEPKRLNDSLIGRTTSRTSGSSTGRVSSQRRIRHVSRKFLSRDASFDFAAQRRRRDSWHGRKVCHESRHRYRVDVRADRHLTRALGLRTTTVPLV